MPIEVPIIYIKEDDKIVGRKAPVVEQECWWCKNPFMYEVEKPGPWDGNIHYYQCCSCGARQDTYGKLFQAGVGERRTEG